MTTVTSTDLKNRLGEVIDLARRGPVRIQNRGRDTVVILDHEEYDRLQRMEDGYWLWRAEQARKEGFLGPDKSMELLESILARED